MIHVATTHNIRTRFPKIDHPGSWPHYSWRLPNWKGISLRNIPYTQTSTNNSPSILSHYLLHRKKHRTRTSRRPVGLPQSSLGPSEGSYWTTRSRKSRTEPSVLRSVSFPTNLSSVLPQSLRHALSCTLCLSLHLFHCLPMRGFRPHTAWHIDADRLVPPPCHPAYFCLPLLLILDYSFLLTQFFSCWLTTDDS